tara:strand:+ start:5639 stop:5911 length:273 start_codon:yes stop_codon:yes gene_type:complete
VAAKKKAKKKGSSNSTTTTLKNMSAKYNVPVGILRQVVKRGQGAYFSSGSRPGQTPTSWGIARARSFASGSGGARKADADLWKKVKKSRA